MSVDRSAEVLEQVPLADRLPRLGEHFVPVFHLDRAALGSEYQLTDGLVATHPVVVHDADDQAGLPYPLVGDDEEKGLVEYRIQRFLLDHRLLLLDSFAVVHQPDLYVRV